MKIAIVTGASSGMGREFVRQLSAYVQVDEIWAIARRQDALEALKAEAVHILLLHNHPSGDPAPSEADRQITECIRELGIKLDIPLIDHIIIGDNKYISFKEQGFL